MKKCKEKSKVSSGVNTEDTKMAIVQFLTKKLFNVKSKDEPFSTNEEDYFNDQANFNKKKILYYYRG